jgi:hypothetical protein
MFYELFVGREIARRQMEDSLDGTRRGRRAPGPEPPRRTSVRSVSAAALRGLAERLEPSAAGR